MFGFDDFEALSGVILDVFGSIFGILEEDADVDGCFLHKIFYKKKYNNVGHKMINQILYAYFDLF